MTKVKRHAKVKAKRISQLMTEIELMSINAEILETDKKRFP